MPKRVLSIILLTSFLITNLSVVPLFADPIKSDRDVLAGTSRFNPSTKIVSDERGEMGPSTDPDVIAQEKEDFGDWSKYEMLRLLIGKALYQDTSESDLRKDISGITLPGFDLGGIRKEGASFVVGYESPARHVKIDLRFFKSTEKKLSRTIEKIVLPGGNVIYCERLFRGVVEDTAPVVQGKAPATVTVSPVENEPKAGQGVATGPASSGQSGGQVQPVKNWTVYNLLLNRFKKEAGVQIIRSDVLIYVNDVTSFLTAQVIEKKDIQDAFDDLVNWGVIEHEGADAELYRVSPALADEQAQPLVKDFWKLDVANFFGSMYKVTQTNPAVIAISHEDIIKRLHDFPSLYKISNSDMVFLKTLYEEYWSAEPVVTSNAGLRDFLNMLQDNLRYVFEVDRTIELTVPADVKDDIISLGRQEIMTGNTIHTFGHLGNLMATLEFTVLDSEPSNPLTSAHDIELFKLFKADVLKLKKSAILCHKSFSIDKAKKPAIHAKIVQRARQLIDEYLRINDVYFRPGAEKNAIGMITHIIGKDKLNDLVTEINRQVAEIRTLKEGLDTMFSEAHSGPVDINASIQKVMDPLLGGNRKIMYDFQKSPPLPQPFVTDTILSAVWDNLGRNAFQAYEGIKRADTESAVFYNEITIRTSLEVKGGRQFIKIEFEDYASGIPADRLNKLFYKGATFDKKGGTGLGLYLVKKTIESFGGTITVASRHISEYPKDHGTTFTILLPVEKPVSAVADLPPIAKAVTLTQPEVKTIKDTPEREPRLPADESDLGKGVGEPPAFITAKSSGGVDSGAAAISDPGVIEGLKTLAGTRELFKEGLLEAPAVSESTILLDENIFIGADGNAEALVQVRSALGAAIKNGTIAILSPEDIRRRAINSFVTKEKMVAVFTEESFENEKIWTQTDKQVSLKASVLVLGSRMTGGNYLYLEGVIGLARAVMAKNERAVKAYYRLMAGVALDDEILHLLKDDDQNNVAFAVKAILKFRPMRIGIDSDEFRNACIAMESALISV